MSEFWLRGHVKKDNSSKTVMHKTTMTTIWIEFPLPSSFPIKAASSGWSKDYWPPNEIANSRDQSWTAFSYRIKKSPCWERNEAWLWKKEKTLEEWKGEICESRETWGTTCDAYVLIQKDSWFLLLLRITYKTLL